jgi:twinkle protein
MGGGSPTQTRRNLAAIDLLSDGVVSALPARKITEDTCVKFGYQKGTYKGKPVQIAPYYNAEGQIVAQKLRFPDKSFKVLGTVDGALPFGAQLWQKAGKMLVVTEGEIDALSMSQVQGNKWPVVSLINGAQSARKLAAKQRDYFLGFEKVIVMFDSDEPGREAALEFASVIGPRAHIAELPMKDANDMLKAGRTAELIDAMWKAKQYRPEGLVTLAAVKDKAKETPRVGLSWPWPNLSGLLSGIQKPYIYTLGAATGAGKTDVLRQIITHLSVTHAQPVGVFSLEEEPHVTAVGFASKVSGKKLHTPEGWDEAAFESAWSQLTAGGMIHLYDSFGMNEWDSIQGKIEYLRHAEGVEYFVVDHLTALASGSDDDRVKLEGIMSRYVVARHAARHHDLPRLPPRYPRREATRGRRAGHDAAHEGLSRYRPVVAFGILGLERNQQAEDPEERHTTTVRILKARGFGWNVGKCTHLKFNEATGMLDERDGPPTTGGSFGFTSSDQEASPEF